MMDKREVLIKAISTGSCPVQILHISNEEWNCNKFRDCKECANRLIDDLLAEEKEKVASKEKIKTCQNCKYYCSTLASKESDYHIHGYCVLWGREIPRFTILDRTNLESGYDDIETGIASCWGFEPGENIKTEFMTNDKK